jgi:CRISPR/Cas system CSM-associated protein Csm3 (group 7 of RAMP superfamily)
MSQNPLNDPQEPRKLNARWMICGTLRLETALHLGGEETERVDMSILRDAGDGKPLLPGTTLTGALRNALADWLAGYAKDEPREVAALFGGARGDDDGSQSPLIVFDAIGEIPEGEGVEIRDGVAISAATGVAEDRKKYDYEVLPAGTAFPVRLDLLIPAPATASGVPLPNESVLLQLLTTALDAFAHGQSAFGAKRSRGLGRVRATWSAKRFGFESPEGWLEWVLSDHQQPLAGGPEHSSILDALAAGAGRSLNPSAMSDSRRRIEIEVDLQVAHDILVRSPGANASAPEVSHLRSGGAAILPGTSLAGAMRSQALRIAKLVRQGNNDSERWIDRLFGPRFEGQRPRRDQQPQASRIRVSESPLGPTQSRQQTRVAIDRFTQGVVQGALFDEQVEVGGRTILRLELRNPEEGELGLVLLVLKDLLEGLISVGGTSSIGRGVLTGSARVTWHDGDGSPPRFAIIVPRTSPSGDAAADIDRAIIAFHDAVPPVPTGHSKQGEMR